MVTTITTDHADRVRSHQLLAREWLGRGRRPPGTSHMRSPATRLRPAAGGRRGPGPSRRRCWCSPDLVPAAAQPPGYDPACQTFSALANRGTTDRSIMIATLLALGLGFALAAAALPGLRPRGRGARPRRRGGDARRVLPQPAQGTSTAHLVAAGWRGGVHAVPARRVSLRPGPAVAASARAPSVVVTGVLLAMLAWFTASRSRRPASGAGRRALVVAQTPWPLVLALGRAGRPPHDRSRPGAVAPRDPVR